MTEAYTNKRKSVDNGASWLHERHCVKKTVIFLKNVVGGKRDSAPHDARAPTLIH